MAIPFSSAMKTACVLVGIILSGVTPHTRTRDQLPASRAQAPSPGAATPGQVPQAPPPQSQGAGSVGGRVLIVETGLPLRRAQVRLSGSGAIRTVTTDEQGRYEIEDVRAGRYTLTASKAGYLTLSYGQRRLSDAGRPVDIADKQSLEGIDFRLPRGSVLVVRVTDEFGEPLPGADVTARQFRYVQGQRALTQVNQGGGPAPVTNDRGERRLSGLAPGEYYIVATAGFVTLQLGTGEGSMTYAPTFYPGTIDIDQAQRVTVAAGQELRVNLSMVVTPTVRISGVIRRPDGTLLPGARASLRKVLVTGFTSANISVMPDGSFTKTNVLPGNYFVDVSSGSGSPLSAGDDYGSTPITVGNANLSGIVVTTMKTAVARGTFVFDTGTAGNLRPGALQISAQGASLSGPSQARSQTNDDWTFEITGLSGPRLFRIPLQTSGWFLKSVMVDGKDVTDTPIDFDKVKEVKDLQIVVTQQRTTVTGAVVDARGAAVSEYVAVVFAEDRERWKPQSRFIAAGNPDQGGRFTVAGLPPGRYLAAAVPFLERGEEQDPEVLARLEGGAMRLTLGEGESRTVRLRLAP